MPTCAQYPEDSKKRPDYFQRRKVGSIRDNPKLLKIRQQFENACQDSAKRLSPKAVGGSAPSSVNLLRKSNACVIDQLLRIRSTNKDKGDAFLQSQLDTAQARRNSEGDAKVRKPLSVAVYENSPKVTRKEFESGDASLGSEWGAPSILIGEVRDGPGKNSSSESGVCTNSSASEEDSSSFGPSRSPALDESANRFFSLLNHEAPPIPRRGLSSAVQNSLVHSCPISSSSRSVRKAIQMYEGMQCVDSKKTSLRRDDSASIRESFLLRRTSRRNSLRKSKNFREKNGTPSSDSPVKKKDTTYSGESIYQTLTTTVNMPRSESNPYDRLNRLHDAVNRIHKGQSSNCAACKAIPSSVLRLRTDDSSFMQIKCNELAPHHHPPCICFACQHSTFTCSEDPRPPPEGTGSVDSLHYNMCCMNSPDRESWRQSRRRPVCEQNGRLCIVNCDMESTGPEKQDGCHPNLRSYSLGRKRYSRHMSGDSCDSDEGWVDITDSEEEKSLSASKRKHDPANSREHPGPQSAVQNASHEVDCLVLKCEDLDISRTTSTEHLYESIDGLSDENTVNSPSDSVAEQNPENDLDSGEWSEESASPTFDESAGSEKRSLHANQHRFTVNSESRETSKKTFMKSVLGKRAVPTKKRRMSNFFVPWLVSAHENESKKCHRISPLKNKRSQSIPVVVSPKTISRTKGTMSSSDLLESSRIKDGDLEGNNLISPDGPPSVCSRESITSSAYLRSDQIMANDLIKIKTCVPIETAIDVVVEKVHKRSPSGNSDHSYFMFKPVKEDDVPLYQFYERNVRERVSFCRSPKSSSPVLWSGVNESCLASDSASKTPVPQLRTEAQDMRMLWCELPEVKESGILERISAQELKLQEAIFDFIQSQASYIRSLKVLFENFTRAPEFSDFESPSCVLSRHEHDVLFSDVVRVTEVSKRLMKEITQRWNNGVIIPDICDIIQRHAVQPTFSVYVKYCSNRVYQERTLKELKETRLCFLEVLRKLESNPVCQGLSLESFLFLPMQHISRLPLLLDNIFRWLVLESPSYGMCKAALEACHKVFIECNEGARKMERLEEMFVLQKQLEFKECKVIPLISASRWLLKKGELTKLEFDKKTFGRSNRCIRVPIYLFLFNDVLIFTKKKNDDCYTVVDYCLREKVQAMAVNAKDLQQPVVVPHACRYLLYLTLSNNHQGSAVDLILNCTLLSERTRWIEAIQNVPQNKSCQVWEYDCPQVQCVRSYIAQQPDELSLQESDVVTVHRKINDGWYEGRRLRDGLQGWFPASYTMDIPCSRVRTSNLRQCYRLLMLSQTQ